MMISPLLRTACLLLAVGCLATPLPAPGQSQGVPPAVGPEPITPVPEPGTLDLMRVALGEQSTCNWLRYTRGWSAPGRVARASIIIPAAFGLVS
jgi:hypothetical protein